MTAAGSTRGALADLAQASGGPDAAESLADPTRRRSLLRWTSSLALVGLAGCGFRLRQPVALPFRRLALAGFSSDMERALRIAAAAFSLRSSSCTRKKGMRAEGVRALFSERKRRYLPQSCNECLLLLRCNLHST